MNSPTVSAFGRAAFLASRLVVSLAGASLYVWGNGIRVFERSSTDGGTTALNGYTQGAPEWIRLERTGNTFDLYPCCGEVFSSRCGLSPDSATFLASRVVVSSAGGWQWRCFPAEGRSSHRAVAGVPPRHLLGLLCG